MIRFLRFVPLVFVLISGCGTFTKESMTLKKASYDELAGWDEDFHQEAIGAFLQSCHDINKRPKFGGFDSTLKWGENRVWQRMCKKAKKHDNNQSKDFFESNFTPYLVSANGRSTGLFTGYYQAEVRGSMRRHGNYQYPLYMRPPELQNGRRFYTRKQIDGGALRGRQLELVWLDDPIDRFFLHVQGSGIVRLDNGQSMAVAFAGKSGHAYTSIGRYLIENGYISKRKMSMQRIDAWLRKNPDRLNEVLQQNASYIFFRKQALSDGVKGAQNVRLTPERSLAIDPSHIPYGMPLWLDVTLNATKEFPKRPLRRLMVAQDTGSAIRGVVRADIYFGSGDQAKDKAGHTKARGRYFVLVPNGVMP